MSTIAGAASFLIGEMKSTAKHQGAGPAVVPNSHSTRLAGRLLVIFAVMVAAVASGLTALRVHGSTAPAHAPAPAVSSLQTGHAGGPPMHRTHMTGIQSRHHVPPEGSPANVHSRQLVP